MKCLITGGAGFIGSHLLHKLLADGHDVRVLDDFSTGSRHNLSPPAQQQRFLDRLEVIEGDIRDKATCLQASRSCTHVFHLAAQTSVPTSIDNPELTLDINVAGFKNILDACVTNETRQFVYSSSSAVYGDSSGRTNKEEADCQPETPYGESKLENERYAEKITKIANINCIGLRYFNVFGPRQQSGHSYSAVIPNWINAIVRNEPISIFGDGSNTRDFLSIRDVIKANVVASESDIRNAVVNIASGHSISLIELYEIMVETYRGMKFDYSRTAKYYDSRKGDISRSNADIEKAKRLLAYRPSDDLQASITEMFELRLRA